jgi:5-bromo-4-chloroindolyl phosphate hydrolysis protein
MSFNHFGDLFSGRQIAQAREQLANWRRGWIGLRGGLLYVLPLPLPLAAVIALARGQWLVALFCVAAFAATIGGARFTRRGLREERLAPERRYTRPSPVPFKYLGAALVCAATVLAAFGAAGHGVISSVMFGLIALAGYHLAYRLEPPAVQLVPRLAARTDQRLQRALAQAEQRIVGLIGAADSVGNAELEQRLLRIAAQGRVILDMIAERPGELFRARQFLNVYLEGAERVASRYARSHRLAPSRDLEQNFRNVLVEIEDVFERQRLELREHDVTDLDIQIEVLRQRLEQEAIV